MFSKLKRLLLGSPLASHRESHERLSIPAALAVFASDALSSTAYATEEILLALVGTAYAAYAGILSIPVAIAIVLLMAIVVVSYRQVIHAYPEGGGAYQVSKANLGEIPSLIAGAALLIDYILTVSVSVSAGVAALTSAGLVDTRYQMLLALLIILAMIYLNLRGLRESAQVLMFPVYTFIGSMAALIAWGCWQVFTGAPSSIGGVAMGLLPQQHGLTQPVPSTAGFSALQAIPFMLLVLPFLKAFSHGCAALTGIEAISNGVKAFKEPVAQNANRTMVIMGVLLASIFSGITFLAYHYHIVPSEHETIISQVARIVFGSGQHPLYYLVQISTMIVLVLAANTSFSGFPRLATILAEDGFLPRQLMSLGDKLVFSNGIVALGILSMLVVVLYGAETHAMIPLYAVGVFLSFTLAQAGMVLHHRQHKEAGYFSGLLINGLGAVVTGIVTLILTAEKFFEGAWIVLVAIPILITHFKTIQHHYRSIAKQLALPESGYCPIPVEHTVLVLVSSLHRGTIPALEYAKTISDQVEAVHVSLNKASTERLQKAWNEWGCGVTLTILNSPYRSITQPLLDYIDEVEKRHEHDLVTIIIPEFVTRHWWQNLLHNQSALFIKTLLRLRKGKVVTTVRYYLDE